MTINFYSDKGGVGLTTIAAAAAMQRSLKLPTVLSVPDRGELSDVAAALGLSTPYEGETLVSGDLSVAIDAPDADIAIGYDAGGTDVLVTRACYLALRRSAASNRKADSIVLLTEPGRCLSARDVEGALGSKVVATIETDPTVARAIDAGLLSARMPKSLANLMVAVAINA